MAFLGFRPLLILAHGLHHQHHPLFGPEAFPISLKCNLAIFKPMVQVGGSVQKQL